MLSWNNKTETTTHSPDVEELTRLPNGMYPIKMHDVVADDQGVYLVLHIGIPGSSDLLMIPILLAEKKEAKNSREVAAACSHALLTKFGQDTAVEVVKFLAKEYGTDWALKYVPLDDHIFELYDEARLAMSILGGDTW